MKLYLSRVSLGVTLLWSTLLSTQAFAQQLHKLHIDDTGKVLKQHQEHHVKAGHKVTWLRHTGGAKPWYVKFDESPCAEGKEFGSDRGKTCTINVACQAQGDPGCKSYSYSSATGATAAMQDPHVVVDPRSAP
jgi:hypothetical protein